jgi:hypothetical protein
MTKENAEHLEAIQDIRQMMKKSTRFLSLSGLSGVFAGIFALGGAVVAYLYLNSIYHNWVRGLYFNCSRCFSIVYFNSLFFL